jgi:aspartate/methionine/tyrosine aminotransferase
MQRAAMQGWTPQDDSWSNLGQGAPEVSDIEGASPRADKIDIEGVYHEYAPVAGQKALRTKVADLYNARYRLGKKSLYSFENVAITAGGRSALTRIAASLGSVNMGHFIPDYTAYEELLGLFKAFVPIPIAQNRDLGYKLSLKALASEISGKGLSVLLLSNPCNPTGQVIEGEELQGLVELGRSYSCSMILDEFYSHYIYTAPSLYSLHGSIRTVSAAAYVEDVDRDPVVIVDGLTKNWRYPGWRISWIIGPKEVIEATSSAGSFLEGGASNIVQTTVLSMLEPEYVERETLALQNCFVAKKDYALNRLRKMGVKVDLEPQGTFYIWADLSELPGNLSDGFKFLEEGLKEKVITVPGIFFDVNPGKRRSHARFSQYSRISFGPSMSELKRGLDAIERVIAKHN